MSSQRAPLTKRQNPSEPPWQSTIQPIQEMRMRATLGQRDEHLESRLAALTLERDTQRTHKPRRQKEADNLVQTRALPTTRKDGAPQPQLRRRDDLLLLVKDSNLVLFGPGLEVKHLVPGFDLCRLTISNLPASVREDVVLNLFSLHGVDQTRSIRSSMETDGEARKVSYLMASYDARLIKGALDGLFVKDRAITVTIRPHVPPGSMEEVSSAGPHLLSVSWDVSSPSLCAGYATAAEAQAKAKRLHRREVQGRRISAIFDPTRSPDRPSSPNQEGFVVILTNLPPNLTLAEASNLAGTRSIRKAYRAQDHVPAFVAHLRSSLGNIPEERFTVTPSNNSRIGVFIQFPTREEREDALWRLVKRRDPGFRIAMDEEHFELSIPRLQYQSQSDQWRSIMGGIRGGSVKICLERCDDERLVIVATGFDKVEVGKLKVRVERLARGERLCPEYWHPAFMDPQKFKNLSDNASQLFGVALTLDSASQGLRVFGAVHAVKAAKRMIQEEVRRLVAHGWEIPISRPYTAPMKDSGLKYLQEVMGEDNVGLRTTSSGLALTVEGGHDAIHRARRLIGDILSSRDRDQDLRDWTSRKESSICPICSDVPTHPEVLECGHICCEPCLLHYLLSADKSTNFPLRCVGNEATCTVPISLSIIQRYLPPQRLSRLFEKSFEAHLESHPSELKYCGTPDCTQMYRCDPNAKERLLYCPSCFAAVSTHERLNDDWAESNNAKRCPSCNVLTQKVEGCNHVTCQCKEHWCWMCRKGFGKEEPFDASPMYAHLNSEHGGIYEGGEGGAWAWGEWDDEEDQILFPDDGGFEGLNHLMRVADAMRLEARMRVQYQLGRG